MAVREAATRPVGAGPGKTVPGTLTYRGADWFYNLLFVSGAKTRVAAPLISTVSRINASPLQSVCLIRPACCRCLLCRLDRFNILMS